MQLDNINLIRTELRERINNSEKDIVMKYVKGQSTIIKQTPKKQMQPHYEFTKLTELSRCIALTNYDIIIIVESWFSSDIVDMKLQLDVYKVFGCDLSNSTSDKSRGVRVLITVRNHIQQDVCKLVHTLIGKLEMETDLSSVECMYLPLWSCGGSSSKIH